jgi:hypothetical protein
MKWKVIAVVSSLFLLLLSGGIAIYLYFFPIGLGWRPLDSASVLTQVKQLDQLVTVRYSIQRVVGLTEPKIPFGEESVLLMVQGQALAGVNLTAIKPQDISYGDNKSVTICLPPAKILNAFLDEKETKVWDHRITWWTPWVPYNPDLEHQARLIALDDLRSAALKMGILNDAQRNAQSAIRDFLKAFHVEVHFKT